MRLATCSRWSCMMIDATTVLDHCIVARELIADVSRVNREMDMSRTYDRCTEITDLHAAMSLHG